MTTLCLKSKNSTKVETWANVFSTFNTEAKSCLFMKQLTTTCISTILHLRKIFPDECFGSKNFEGMTLKLLQFKKGYAFVDKVEQWLEGAFEAIDKKYLKNIMLDIKDAQTKMTLEVYTMTFLYQKGNEAPSILLSASESTKNNFRGCSFSNTQMKTMKLLQMCYAVTQRCENLPRQVTLSMRLSYYEGTPQDYQPKGYKAWEPTHFQFPKDPRSVEIGVTGTNHHLFKLVNKSCLNDQFFKDMEKQNYEENISLNLNGGTCNNLTTFNKEYRAKAKKELLFDDSNSGSKSDFIPSSLRQISQTDRKISVPYISSLVSNENKIKTDEMAQDLKENSMNTNFSEREVTRVRCPCLSEKKSDVMFACLSCQNLVHGECFGVLELVHTKKIRFHCHLCYKANMSLKCHDRIMISLKDSGDQQKLALLRRMLKFCNSPEITKLNLKTMEKIAGLRCPKKVLEIILNKMVNIGVVVPHGRKKNYSINKKELSDKLSHYFYQSHIADSMQPKVTPISARTPEMAKRKTSDYADSFDNKKFRSSFALSQTNKTTTIKDQKQKELITLI